MSIIEKALKSAGSGYTPKKPPGRPSSPDRGSGSVDRQAGEVPGGRILNTSQVAERGMLTLDSDPQLAKDFRFLKRPILARVFGTASIGTNAGKVVMIMSHSPQVGKSFVAYNLAVSMAYEQMTHVLLIDGDPFRRSLTHALDLDDQIGLQDVLNDTSLNLSDAIVPTDLPALQVLPSGMLRTNSTELFASRRMSELLDSLHDPDLVVVLDAPPLRETSEGRALAEKADHALIVVGAGQTTAPQINSVLKMFETSKSSVSFVLNRAVEVIEPHDSAYYPYYEASGTRENSDPPSDKGEN